MSDNEGYDAVARFPSEREARNAVESLTVQGIGATWEPTPTPDPDTGRTTFTLLVVTGDGPRARAALGLPDEPADETPPRRRLPDWAYVAIVFAIALVVLPLIGFLVSYKLSGG